MAQAQGMHIDGERWRLSRKDTETRRRLWSNLYLLDKTIALSLGRPFAIVDQQCLVEKASNVWLDDMDDETAASAPVLPVSEPTPSLSNRLCHELAIIIGAIQEKCFGLFTVSYDTVLALDREILEWRNRLPPYFRLEDPDLSLDSRLPYLAWHRLHLHSMYHFARVTLHRPYLLRPSITNRFRTSHDACIASACADLSMRLQSLSQPLQDRLRWTLGPHYLFNSALVLGIIAVRDPFSHRSLAILEDLAAYCAMQRRDIWVNEFALAEVKIVELCIKKARELRGGSEVGIPNVSSVNRPNADIHTPSSLNDAHIPMADGPAGFGQASAMDFPGLGLSSYTTVFTNDPSPWLMTTLKSSPCLKNTGGVLLTPIPHGVPVRITVPASSVVPWLRYATISATPKIMSSAHASCTTAPFSTVRSSTARASRTRRAADTTHGPTGANPSKPFPNPHCAPANWCARAVTSLAHAYPST
ncbi:hypothetical protein SLS57_010591 [Botryosphaeria dothidea]